MPITDPDARREANRRYYEKHKGRQRKMRCASRKATRDRLRSIIDEAKSAPCMDCNKRYPPYVMDLDHRDPSKKVSSVAMMVNRFSEQAIRDEIDKCDAVCANCHRERTHGHTGRRC